jgi:L-seryl-tRNA(Ser) seleniumtransferase
VSQITPVADTQTEYRKLPSVDALLRRAEVAALLAEFSPAQVTDAVRGLLDESRAAIHTGERAPDEAALIARLAEGLERSSQPSLRGVINATGVIIHTNLGRAPLSVAARQAIQSAATGYNNLEYDIAAGERGSRHTHARQLLRQLTGAEDALVVNNNAGAVFLVLSALCVGKEVIISRGELVEIGGGFRIPDVLRQSGAKLVEVGTTNRTHPQDFAKAIRGETGALMRVHASNFQQIGFVTKPSLAELVQIAQDVEWPGPPPVIDDLGSGTLLDTAPFGLSPEPTVQQSIAAGADIVTFSGDKLLGGPQAGLIVGRADLIDRIRRHPLTRALRVDKLTLAGLEATLQAYRRGKAVEEIPVWQMIAATPESLRARAESWRERLAGAGLSAAVIPGQSTVGGGSLPGETLPTFLLALTTHHPDATAARLRQANPPVVGRIQQERLLFDPRTVLPEQEEALLAAIVAGARQA